MYEQGIVKKVKNRLAYVEIQKKAQCDGCKLCAFAGESSLVLPSVMETECHAGDTVVLEMPARPVPGASLLIFFMPLVLFFAGLLAGMPFGEVYMLILGFGFTALGVAMSFLADRLLRFNPKFLPIVTDKIWIEKPTEKEVEEL